MATLTLGSWALVGQDQAAPCAAPEREHAAFLTGEWTVRVRDRVALHDDEWRERAGTSTWQRKVSGCALVENLTLGEGADEHAEMRVLAYDQRSEEWDLMIVDSAHGNIITMTGCSVGDGLEFTSAQSRRGQVLLDRVVYEPGENESIEVWVETSFDSGGTWIALQTMEYLPKGGSVATGHARVNGIRMLHGGSKTEDARYPELTAQLIVEFLDTE